MSERNVQDLTFTIPDDSGPADMPAIFQTYTDGMPESTKTTGTTTSVTSADTNKIFEFSTAEGGDPTETTVSVTGTGFWKVDTGKNYGMQFGIVTGNDKVTLTTDEADVSFLPLDTILADSFAIVTRISNTVWLVAGGSNTASNITKNFIFNDSLLNGGDQFA